MENYEKRYKELYEKYDGKYGDLVEAFLKLEEKNNKKDYINIFVEGGLIQDALTNIPDVEIYVFDYDMTDDFNYTDNDGNKCYKFKLK